MVQTYIPVADQVTPALGQLTSTVLGITQDRREQEAKQEAKEAEDAKKAELEQATTDFQTAVANSDFDTIANLSLKYPKIGENALQLLGVKNDRTKQNAVDTLFDLVQRPDDFESILTNRKNLVISEGGDPIDTEDFIETYKADPKAADKLAHGYLARVAPDRYKAYKEATTTKPEKQTATIQEYNLAKEEGFEGSFLDYKRMASGAGDKPTTAQKNYNLAVKQGYKGTFLDYQKETKGGTTVNVGAKGLSEESKQLAKNRADRYDDIIQGATAAESDLFNIDQLRGLNLDTGFGTEAKSDVVRALGAFGVDTTELLGTDPAEVEKFNSIAQKQVLNIMATQKGPQTDQDAERIKKTIAQTTNTKEANQFILNTMEAVSRRKVDQAAFYEEFLNDNETLKGVDRAWRAFKRKTPMFSEKVKNPTTGKPMFYFEFRNLLTKEGRPEKEIIEAWQDLNKRGKK